MRFQDDGAIGVVNEMVTIPIRAQDVSEPPTVGLGAGDFWEPIFAREHELVAQMRETTPLVECHVTAMKLGDLAIVTCGAELFVQPSLDIQRASPFKKTWTVTLANEYIGYVPTASAHFAGGYEPRTARSSYLAPQAAQLIVDTSLAALRGVHDAG